MGSRSYLNKGNGTEMKDLTATSLLLAAACGLAAMSATAVEYKWVDRDGRVHYGDHPPADHGAVALRKPGGVHTEAPPRAAADPTLDFPLALRTAARNHPVELYVANDCGPCRLAAQLLRQRGIPFQEWRVSSHADFARFKELGFTENGFPAISVGNQRSIGFEAMAWHRLLDGAQYPKNSLLPSSYQYPAIANLSHETPVIGAMTVSSPGAQGPKVLPTSPNRVERKRAEPRPEPQGELRF